MGRMCFNISLAVTGLAEVLPKVFGTAFPTRCKQFALSVWHPRAAARGPSVDKMGVQRDPRSLWSFFRFLAVDTERKGVCCCLG